MACCEPEAEFEGMCLEQNTCDTEFSVRIENFSILRPIGTAIVLGEFENMNMITFPMCGEIVNGVQNPLVFTFSTNDYNATGVCYCKKS